MWALIIQYITFFIKAIFVFFLSTKAIDVFSHFSIKVLLLLLVLLEKVGNARLRESD